KLAPGTYSQVRLFPVDPAAPLTSSAQSAGARYNAEADYVDNVGTTGTPHQLPLELLNPEQGIGIPGTLKVPVGDVGAALTGATTPRAGGTRHVVVGRAPVHADGRFLPNPLATRSSSPTEYDLVIHGPGIATIIIKAVQVTLASSSAATTTTTGTAANATLNTV